MKAKTCVDTKEVTVKLLRQDDVSEEASSDKAMLILIDGYFDSAYDENGNSVWSMNNYRNFGTNNLGIDYNKFDVYVIGFKPDCTGLNNAAVDIGSFISTLQDYEQINLLGISKGATVFCKALENIPEDMLKKTNLYTVASPFKGTILASPEQLKEQARKKLPIIGSIIYKKLYEPHYTYTPVDNDIGLEADFIKSLDTDRMKAVLSKVNFINIVTSCNRHSLVKAIKKLDGMAILQHILSGAIVKGDGIVHKDSQNYFSPLAKKVVPINGPHSWILGEVETGRYIGQIIKDTISGETTSCNRERKGLLNRIRHRQSRRGPTGRETRKSSVINVTRGQGHYED